MQIVTTLMLADACPYYRNYTIFLFSVHDNWRHSNFANENGPSQDLKFRIETAAIIFNGPLSIEILISRESNPVNSVSKYPFCHRGTIFLPLSENTVLNTPSDSQNLIIPHIFSHRNLTLNILRDCHLAAWYSNKEWVGCCSWRPNCQFHNFILLLVLVHT